MSNSDDPGFLSFLRSLVRASDLAALRAELHAGLASLRFEKAAQADLVALAARVRALEQATSSPPPVAPQQVFFDDFAYRAVDDPAVTAHGWRLVDGASGPAPVGGARYSQDSIAFADDPGLPGNRHLVLKLVVSSTAVQQCRLETVAARLLHGTWAARVFFDPLSGVTADRYQDAPVEAFWGYRPGGEALPSFSEIDIGERLPRNVWGRGPVSDGALWFTSWGQNAPQNKIVQSSALVGRFPGWHILSAQVAPGTPPASVRFFLDDQPVSTVLPPAAPDAPMNLSLGHWLAERGPASVGLPDQRTYLLLVDWILYGRDVLWSVGELRDQVAAYRARGWSWLDTVRAA